MLTLTGDGIRRWKEYFEDLLNLSDTPYIEEAEMEDSGVDSSITQAEVTDVVCNIRSGKASGEDEIRPNYFKSLDVLGLSWLSNFRPISNLPFIEKIMEKVVLAQLPVQLSCLSCQKTLLMKSFNQVSKLYKALLSTPSSL